LIAVILTKPLDKDRFSKAWRVAAARLYHLGRQHPVALPDDRTAVVVHEELAERYLVGYAKDKNAWPMSKALKSAAEKNDLVVSFRPALLSDAMRRRLDEVAPALGHAKQYVLAANLMGTEVQMGYAGFTDGVSKTQGEAAKRLGEAVRVRPSHETAAHDQ
jgi:hypothetical protein